MLRAIATTALLLLPAFASAQSCGTRDLISELGPAERTELDALVAEHAYAVGNLFQAEKPGSRVTVVGTLHLPDPRHSAILEEVRPALAEADLLILEATSETQAEIQSMAATRPELFFFTEGPTLIDLLTEEEWSQIEQELTAYGIPSFMAAKFQPWFLGMTLAVPPCALTQIQSGGQGLDMLLESAAREYGVPMAELDQLDALMDLLAGDPIEQQIEGLRVWLAMKERGDAEMTTLVERYFQGKSREVIEYSRLTLEDKNVPVEDFDEMMQAILHDRNVAWEPKFVELVEGKNSVLAVGAAHLSGESGVLRALERAGYTITRL